MFERLLKRFWFEKSEPGFLLRFLNRLSVFLIRRRRYQWRYRDKPEFEAPVVVIGNISVGGAGKTPVVLALAQWFTGLGLKVGIVSRGYGARPKTYPFIVSADTDPRFGGDEPCMMAARLGCPIVIDPDRPRAVAYLLSQWPETDVILSDDGLQHYRMNRSVELVVVDARRGFGNGLCLPWGPLREPIDRLKDVMALIVNGASSEGTAAIGDMLSVPAMSMRLKTQGFYRVLDDAPVSLQELTAFSPEGEDELEIAAVAGIGHPERFFSTLGQMGIHARGFAFKDHHHFKPRDFTLFEDAKWILMTEKDAVKVRGFAKPNWIYLAVSAEFSPDGWKMLTQKLLELLQPWPNVAAPLKKHSDRLALRAAMNRQS